MERAPFGTEILELRGNPHAHPQQDSHRIAIQIGSDDIGLPSPFKSALRRR
jgi:hypothetical protein